MIRLNDEALVAMDLRLGRLDKTIEYLAKNPHSLNGKIFAPRHWGQGQSLSFLELSVNFGHPHVVQWLISQGAKETSSTAPGLLSVAANQSNKEICSQLTKMGFDPWEGEFPPMHVAASLGWVEGLMQWKRMGYKLNTLRQGRNLCHVAIEHAQNMDMKKLVDVCHFLFTQGVKWAPDEQGRLPSDFATHQNQALVSKIEHMWHEYESQATKKALKRAVKKKSPSLLSSKASSKPSSSKPRKI